MLGMKNTPTFTTLSRWWQPNELARRLPNLKARNVIAAALRDYFFEHDFTEVETPALQISPGMEPHLTAFATDLLEPFDQQIKRLYLHTSPEFAMKKLLVGGMERIFQLCKTWRNAERSTTHHPEFTMLEWYRANRDWRAGAGDCVALIRAAGLVTKGFRNGTMTVNRSEKNCDLNELPDYLSVAEAFTKFCDIDLLATTSDPLFPNRDLLAEEAERLKVYVRLQDDWETIFFRLFLELIEPNLGCERPTVLYDWPLSMAALSRQSADDKRIAERFEIYVCGLELANGFSELIDAAEQRRRFEVDSEKKKALYGYSYPMDEDFLDALVHGLPESTGIALGFDRLVMLCTGAKAIEDVLWAPVVQAP